MLIFYIKSVFDILFYKLNFVYVISMISKIKENENNDAKK